MTDAFALHPDRADAFGPGSVQLEYTPSLTRNSLTVFFRWILLIPQYIVLALLALIGFLLAIIGWVGALASGRLPDSIAVALERIVDYGVRVGAYGTLLTDVYPPFSFDVADYPLRARFGQRTSLNRLAVLFRFVLLIPAGIIYQVLVSGVQVVNIVNWLISFLTGRTLPALYEMNLAVQRYSLRFFAFALMLTADYPAGVLGDGPTMAGTTLAEGGARTRIEMSENGRTVLWLAIAIGIILTVINRRP